MCGRILDIRIEIFTIIEVINQLYKFPYYHISYTKTTEVLEVESIIFFLWLLIVFIFIVNYKLSTLH